VLAAVFLCAAPIVHDGDSIRCDGERIRIENVDAPELADSPKCTDPRRRGWCDNAAAIAARDSLRAFLAQGPVMVRRTGVDPYRRTLARVTVNGVDAGDYLVGLGLARVWK